MCARRRARAERPSVEGWERVCVCEAARSLGDPPGEGRERLCETAGLLGKPPGEGLGAFV